MLSTAAPPPAPTPACPACHCCFGLTITAHAHQQWHCHRNRCSWAAYCCAGRPAAAAPPGAAAAAGRLPPLVPTPGPFLASRRCSSRSFSRCTVRICMFRSFAAWSGFCDCHSSFACWRTCGRLRGARRSRARQQRVSGALPAAQGRRQVRESSRPGAARAQGVSRALPPLSAPPGRRRAMSQSSSGTTWAAQLGCAAGLRSWAAQLLKAKGGAHQRGAVAVRILPQRLLQVQLLLRLHVGAGGSTAAAGGRQGGTEGDGDCTPCGCSGRQALARRLRRRPPLRQAVLPGERTATQPHKRVSSKRQLRFPPPPGSAQSPRRGCRTRPPPRAAAPQTRARPAGRGRGRGAEG